MAQIDDRDGHRSLDRKVIGWSENPGLLSSSETRRASHQGRRGVALALAGGWHRWAGRFGAEPSSHTPGLNQ